METTIIEWQPGEMLPVDFISLPHELYIHDEFWLPEARQELVTAFSGQNPYFANNTAHIWVIPGQVRMAGFYDPALRIQEEKVAFFGFWETVDEVLANQQVFGAFENWAYQQGVTLVFGPVNFNTYGKYRIRLQLQPGEGCFHGEPYNPAYYQSILEACGYTLQTTYQSQFIPESQIEAVYAQKEELQQKMSAKPFRIVHLTPQLWMERLGELYQMIDSTFKNNFAYTPVSFQTFAASYGERFAKRFCPNLSVAALNEQDQIIGFAIGLPDYASLCRNGLANPLKPFEITYASHFPLLTSPTLLIKTLGVLPAYRNSGVMNTMCLYLMLHFKTYYKNAMACLMKSDNYSTYFFKNSDAHIRLYGLYGKKIR